MTMVGCSRPSVHSLFATARSYSGGHLGGLLRGTLPRSPSAGGDPGWEDLPAPVGDLTLYFEDNALDDLYLLLRWQG
jgi:hypothetical protein